MNIWTPSASPILNPTPPSSTATEENAKVLIDDLESERDRQQIYFHAAHTVTLTPLSDLVVN